MYNWASSFWFNSYWTPLMVSLDKCNWSCNDTDDLSTKICVPSEINDVNVKVFKTTTWINDCECQFNSTTCNSNQEQK